MKGATQPYHAAVLVLNPQNPQIDFNPHSMTFHKKTTMQEYSGGKKTALTNSVKGDTNPPSLLCYYFRWQDIQGRASNFIPNPFTQTWEQF